MKMRVFSSLLACAVIGLVTSAVTAQEAKPAPRPAPAPAQPAPSVAEQIPVPAGPTQPPPAVAGQTPDSSAPAEKLPTLEEVIAEVIKSNPDVQVAEAQLREAEAKLRQAQMQAVQKATEVYQQRIQAEKNVASLRQSLNDKQEMKKNGNVTDGELTSTQRLLSQVQSEAARYGAELQSIMGTGLKALGKTLSDAGSQESGSVVPQPRPSLDSIKDEKLKNKLAMPVSMEFGQQNLAAITDYLVEAYDLNVVIDFELAADANPFSVRLLETPLKDCLLAIADACGNTVFVIRDYGIFATTYEKAQHIAAPCIPDTVPLYVRAAEAPESPARVEPTPPQETAPKF